MNFIFQSYPEHPWFAKWTFEPRGCSSAFRKTSAGLFFQSTKTVGRIIPNTEEPEWSLQIPVPQNSRTHILFNSFCAYFEQKKERYGAEVIVPEPGVLWGRTIGIPAPVMASNHPIEQNNGFQWLETDTACALLVVQDNRFCLVTKARLEKDAIQLAETYLSKDIEALLVQEFEQRAGAKNLFEEMAHHDSLAAICAESMMKALRPAEGSIPLAWCQSSETDVPQLDLNELYPLVLAWRLIDIGTAEELVACALKIQTNSGAIPVHYAPHATHSTIEAPKPFLAKTVETVWKVRKDDELLKTLLPPLRRHVQWLLLHFDPKRRGLHCWKSQNEPMAPESYESDMATVDLTVLLLTEIEALNRLRSQSSIHTSDPEYFEKERNTLEHNLLDQFWNDKESAFTNALVRDKVVNLHGFPAFTPLLWDKLPNLKRNTVLEHVHESGTLPGGLSVLSWRKSALDDNSFPLLQQLLVFQALKTAEPHGQLLNDFSRITLQGFVEWHTLCLEENNRLHINPVTAAYIMNVQSIRQYRYYAKGPITGYFFNLFRKSIINRFELLVVAACAFLLFSMHSIYSVLNAPPPFDMLEAQMNSAYANKNTPDTLKNCMAIIHHYPDEAAQAQMLGGNILLLQQNHSGAAELFEQVRQSHPDSPGAMIALGLTYQLQGRFQEAEKNYYEFCYIFEEIFPELVDQINHHRYLLQEGFRTPPKWQKIYSYQLMHEL